jgi:hypothetical protein
MNSATNFSGTIEFLFEQRAAIVALHDSTGEWAGAGRIDLRIRAFETAEALTARLYEAGYRLASLNAASKGGRLETYRVFGT